VAATNRDIEVEVAEKRFRQDLFYRLNVVRLRVPPLRERAEDIPLLAEHFLERANARSLRKKRLTTAAVQHLQTYAFPGNVRELENLVEQAAALAEDDELLPEDFPFRPRAKEAAPQGARSAEAPAQGSPLPTLADAVAEAERRTILAALERSPKDLAQVAEELAISSTTLWRKMKRLGLKTPNLQEIAPDRGAAQ
jgi:two-component system response regulator HydG